jgi:hypothetical protein
MKWKDKKRPPLKEGTKVRQELSCANGDWGPFLSYLDPSSFSSSFCFVLQSTVIPMKKLTNADPKNLQLTSTDPGHYLYLKSELTNTHTNTHFINN